MIVLSDSTPVLREGKRPPVCLIEKAPMEQPRPIARPSELRDKHAASILPASGSHFPSGRAQRSEFMLFDLFKACVLGIVEGLTEYLPVSSTGHLLLMDHFFGFDDDEFGKAFVVLIQLGAILALLSIYFVRQSQGDAEARRFVIGVLIAFLPAAVIGAL